MHSSTSTSSSQRCSQSNYSLSSSNVSNTRNSSSISNNTSTSTSSSQRCSQSNYSLSSSNVSNTRNSSSISNNTSTSTTTTTNNNNNSINSTTPINIESLIPSPDHSSEENISTNNNNNTLPKRRKQRGFSTTLANEPIVRAVRNKFLANIKEGKESPFVESSQETFLLPDLFGYSIDFRDFLERDLMEISHLTSLEQSGRLNWWWNLGCLSKLWPLSTSGDGNCLLHASSLAMWGVHDRELLLRHELYHFMWNHIMPGNSRGGGGGGGSGAVNNNNGTCSLRGSSLPRSLFSSSSSCSPSSSSASSSTLTSSYPQQQQQPHNSAFFRRWRWQTQRENAQLGFSLTEDQWTREWNILVRLSTPSPKVNTTNGTINNQQQTDRNNCSPKRDESPSPCLFPLAGRRLSTSSPSDVYDSLEHIHVFALSHVLRRPIIVVADSMLCDAQGLALQPILFGGIYLPLLEPPQVCHKDPLLLAYKDAHFSALVPMESNEEENGDSGAIRYGIPLIDPQTLKLLPVHYAVDPGPDWDWQKGENISKKSKKLELNERDQCQLLEKYLNCIHLPIRRLSGDNGGPVDHVPLRRSASKSIPNEERKSSKTRIINDLSKSMGQKLKRVVSGRRGSGSQWRDQISHADIVSLSKKLHDTGLFVAKLKPKLPQNYNIMIANYLLSARERFKELNGFDEEIVHHENNNNGIGGGVGGGKVALLNGTTTTTTSSIVNEVIYDAPTCIRPGCDMFGSPATDYYCSRCYRTVRVPSPPTAAVVTATPPRRSSPSQINRHLLRSLTDNNNSNNKIYNSQEGRLTNDDPPPITTALSTQQQQQQQHSSSVSPNSSSSTSSLSSSTLTANTTLCRNMKCHNRAQWENQGFCSSCLKMMTMCENRMCSNRVVNSSSAYGGGGTNRRLCSSCRSVAPPRSVHVSAAAAAATYSEHSHRF